jgi:hypothetical protein
MKVAGECRTAGKVEKVSMHLAVAIAGTCIAAVAAADPAYMSADFSAGLTTTSSMKIRLAEVGYDSSVPVPSTGIVDVFSIGAIPSVSTELVFELNIDGLSFHFGDTGIHGGPAIQPVEGPSRISSGLANLEPFHPANQDSLPEPTTLAFLASGLTGLGLRRRKEISN